MEYKYETVRKDSNSHLRENRFGRNSELTGYCASEKEKSVKEAPTQEMRLENKNGIVSMGVNEKKEITLVVTGKGNNNPNYKADAKIVKREGAIKKNLVSDNMLTNSHNKEESALAYKMSAMTTPKYIASRLSNMMAKERDNISEDMFPFLRQKEDTEKIKKLEELRVIYSGKRNQRGLKTINKELTTLENDRIHKEQEEEHFINNLKHSIETMQKPGKKKVSVKSLNYVEELTSIDLDDTEEDEASNNSEIK